MKIEEDNFKRKEEKRMNDFYGKEEVNIPVISNYFKFEEGDNQFRILGSFSEKTVIQGIEYWTTVDGVRKPKRLQKKADGTWPSIDDSELEINKFGDLDRPKYFWAFPVWNYQEKKVQILEINQSTILKYLKKVIANPKWGDPRDYDIVVNRTEENGKTIYTTTNDPKEKLDKSIIETYTNMNINIQALFSGDDPFTTGGEKEAEDLANDAEKAGL